MSILFLSLLLTVLAYGEDERIFSVSEKGKIHEYEDGFWKKVNVTDLERKNFTFQSKRVRIDADTNTVAIDNKGKGNFVDSGLRPPGKGIVYTQAVLDDEGNLSVVLSGNGQGFNYLLKGAKEPILASKMEWEPSFFPTKILKLREIPYSASLLALGADGKLYRIDPANSLKKSFEWELVPKLKNIDALYRREGSIFVSGPSFGLAEIDPDSYETFRVKVPSGTKKFFSNKSPSSLIQSILEEIKK